MVILVCFSCDSCFIVFCFFFFFFLLGFGLVFRSAFSSHKTRLCPVLRRDPATRPSIMTNLPGMRLRQAGLDGTGFPVAWGCVYFVLLLRETPRVIALSANGGPG